MPWFRNGIRHRRCLIPADGFFEWTGPKGHKQPYPYRVEGGQLLTFAGLGDRWQGWKSPAW